MEIIKKYYLLLIAIIILFLFGFFGINYFNEYNKTHDEQIDISLELLVPYGLCCGWTIVGILIYILKDKFPFTLPKEKRDKPPNMKKYRLLPMSFILYIFFLLKFLM